MPRVVQIFIAIGVFSISWACGAQNLRVIGDLKDQQTDMPIAYAHIIFTKTKYGTTSNEKGRFSLEVDSTLLREFVRISCVGYESQLLPASELSNRVTYLKPNVEKLNAVVVGAVDLTDKTHSVTLNPFRGKQRVGLGNFSGGAYPSVLARYYPNDFQTDLQPYIDQVTIYLSPPFRWESTFRLRILAATDSLTPAADILLRNRHIQTRKSQRRLVVDLSEYGIKVPKNGFFVAVEHLFILKNQFEERMDIRFGDTLYNDVRTMRYGPVFSGVEEKPEVSISYYRSNTGWKSMEKLRLSETGNTFKNGKTASPAFKVKVVY